MTLTATATATAVAVAKMAAVAAIYVVGFFIVTVVAVVALLIPLVTFALALVSLILHASQWRGAMSRKDRYHPQADAADEQEKDVSSSQAQPTKHQDQATAHQYQALQSLPTHITSAIYQGHVSHTRFKPVIHAFRYPLFMCFLDLDEAALLFGNDTHDKHDNNRTPMLWPLNWLVYFSSKDHLKNGEGRRRQRILVSKSSTSTNKKSSAGADGTGTGNTLSDSTQSEQHDSSSSAPNSASIDSDDSSIGTAHLLPHDAEELKERVLRLVQERTQGKIKDLAFWLDEQQQQQQQQEQQQCHNNENGNHQEYKVCLLTHLRYFGYCFNPVSFYYVMKRNRTNTNNTNHHQQSDTNSDDNTGTSPSPSTSHSNSNSNTSYTTFAIVAEVSNTPWNEMYCYVLHPDSVDVNTVQPGRVMHRQSVNAGGNGVAVADANTGEGNKDSDTASDRPCPCPWPSTNYVFDKNFHVSPFMDMNHEYDWTLWDIDAATNTNTNSTLYKDEIAISTTMNKHTERERGDPQTQKCTETTTPPTTTTKSKTTYFNAFVRIQRCSMHPWRVAWQLVHYPVYCLLVQIWIHVEALQLFTKGVPFVPHPDAAETRASKLIGHIMVPFFALKEYWQTKTARTCTGTCTSTNSMNNAKALKAE
jgi:DUF1365 family protein